MLVAKTYEAHVILPAKLRSVMLQMNIIGAEEEYSQNKVHIWKDKRVIIP